MRNYNVYQRNKSNELHAGISIAVKKNIKHQILDDTIDDVLAVKLETSRGPIILCTLYIPPRHNILPMQDLMKFIRKTIPVYIIGDMNARHPVLGYSNSNAVGNGIRNLMQRNLIYHLGPEFDTWFRPPRKGRPDIVLGNRNVHHNISIQAGPASTSDHVPLIIKVSGKPIVIKGKEKYKIKKANWNKFKEHLEEASTKMKIANRDVNKKYIDENLEKWHKAVTSAMDIAIPRSEYKTLPHPRETKTMKKLQMQYKMINELSSRRGWTIPLRYLYNQIQEKLKEESIKNYQENWHKIIQTVEIKYNKPREFWADIKKLMGGKEEKITYMKNENGDKLYSDKEKEELFRKEWKNVFRISNEENRKFCQEKEREVAEYMRDNIYRTKPYNIANINRLDKNNYLTKPIELYHIKLIIKNFKEKAPGQTEISKAILENVPNTMMNIFKDIINLTISMGYFPDYFKTAILCFLGKPNKDLTRPINYRPISLLEVTGKILERILCDRISRYLESNDILNENQFGFRKGRGTQIALASLYEKISLTQKRKCQCNLVCRDIKKAFDKVWHEGLKFKILQLNLPDVIEKILCSFITDRYAKIRINNVMGPPIPLHSGVPQGGILSPLLFIYYTHDTPKPSPGCYNVQFADDNTQIISYPGKSRKMLAKKTEREIKKLNKYEKTWKIATNKDKFQIVSISTYKPEDIIIENRVIQFKRSATALGLNIKTRGISNHITTRNVLARAQLKKLERFRKMSTKTRLHLYKALVRPMLEYPVVPICLAKKTSIQKLQRTQNIAIRKAAKEGLIRTHTNERLHNMLKIEPINTRLYNQAASTWARLEKYEPNLILLTNQLRENQEWEHLWWPTLSKYIANGPPPSRYL